MSRKTKKRLPRVILIQGSHLQERRRNIAIADCHPPSAAHHQRHNAGAKTAVVLVGLPVVVIGRSRIEQRAGCKAARMMMPSR
ncbi:MAG: hypothetical protein KBB51_03960 [Candidatus Moranbacteria bacterium]|nr:hypothetical protein [Candidatus Moranbacteria bacterium]